MKLISACMMVKNEQDLLPKCLRSLIGTVDELCIIDTGSSDDTIKIIKEFSLGTHGIRVRFQEIPWNGDFSWMRNKTIEMAHTRWVMIIDADETIRYESPMDARSFRNHIKQVEKDRPDVKSLAFTLNDWHGEKCVMKCATARIFIPEVRYEGIIHNTPKIDSDSALIQGAILDHVGYALSEEKMAIKFQRTYGSLMKQLEDEPDHPHTEFYLCQLFGTRNMNAEALEWGEKYIKRYTRGNEINTGINPTVFYSMGRMYNATNEHGKARMMCDMGLALNPEDPDLMIVLSDVHAANSNLMEMAMAAKQYLIISSKLEKTGITGKFYFSLNEPTRHVAFQRIAIGCMGEALNATMSCIKHPHVEPGVIESLQAQFEEWGIGSIVENLRGRA